MIKVFEKSKRIKLIILLTICLYSSPTFCQQINRESHNREITNIAAFGRAYGIARFFYPSQNLQELNWNNFLIYGVGEVRNARNDAELILKLEKLFQPITPKISFSRSVSDLKHNQQTIQQGDSIMFWQHVNFSNIGENKGAKREGTAVGKLVFTKYDSALVLKSDNLYTKANPDPSHVEYYNFDRFFNEENYLFNRNFEQYVLKIQPNPTPSVSELSPNILINYPIVLTVTKEKLNLESELIRKLNISYKDFVTSLEKNNSIIFYADYLFVWNIINHFYSYRKRAEELFQFSWNNQLIAGLNEISSAKNVDETTKIIRTSIQLFQDSHADVYNYTQLIDGVDRRRWLPFYTERVDNRIFVIKSIDSEIRIGDEILEINGKAISFLLDSLAKRKIGPDRFIKRDVLTSLGFTYKNKKSLKVKRDNKEKTIVLNTITHKDYFKLAFPANPYGHNGIEQISKAVYYINLGVVSATELRSALPALLKAKHIVVDLRDYPQGHKEFYTHLIKSEFGKGLYGSAPINMYPNQSLTYYVFQMALDVPVKPIIQAKLSVIINAETRSRGETVSSWFKEQGATLYGETTAGAAGGIDSFTTPGKISFVLTSGYYLRQNLEEMQIVGIKPDYQILPAIKDIQQGKDSVLEQVIKMINKN
jgi:C-terminal processing protease CtpA/Prc